MVVNFGCSLRVLCSLLYLLGKDIFQGCCHLRIGFSTLQELNVKQNGPTARDFTVPQQQHSAHQHGHYHPYSQQYGVYPPQSLISSHSQHINQQSHLTQHYSSPNGMNLYTPHEQYSQPQQGAVVLVSNLPERVTPDQLFTLFGVYGDVLRVKILYNKRDTALIQYAHPQQAYLASLHYHHIMLFDKQINVTPSKHIEVSLPKQSNNTADSADSQLTRDYEHSHQHRFRRTGINTKSIHPPSQVLHISSLADQVTEDELSELFQPSSPSPVVVQFFTTTNKVTHKLSRQAFVKLDSVNSAIESLLRTHNYQLHGKYLRVSFSSKDPNQVGQEQKQQNGTNQQTEEGQQQQQ